MSKETAVIEKHYAANREIRWHAITNRDSRFDGAFVFGVRSTGIYCKPSCPARRPLRENVEFFDSTIEAQQNGFRACLRCLPDSGLTPDPQAQIVSRVCQLIEANNDASLSSLSQQLKLSPHHLQRTFKNLAGITPRQYAEALRVQRFKAEIKEGRDVTNAMYEAGYNASSRLYEKASAQLGMTPATYRKGAEGMSIGYTIVDCELGRMLVAATERGVCSVTFGDRDEKLIADLNAEYPAAEIKVDDDILAQIVSTILNYLSGKEPRLDLPLDLQATAFRLRVWKELRRIPYGETRSYSEVAAAIGQPTATRAVASACAANPVALVTPCHRVVREGGELSGYRWGVERKRKLLEKERDISGVSN
ncbi:MAG TPA: bifunctional DNA-binding transcriptional regulator/O6-methylguanine-DNA methyltransferase Ada [Blastocatellia bacterium]|nr:bifunctional DNA-binding transcriptional regulator/O6-methylguanine-DNA methyltransferase Ada [Blastocatellia bacterium]